MEKQRRPVLPVFLSLLLEPSSACLKVFILTTVRRGGWILDSVFKRFHSGFWILNSFSPRSLWKIPLVFAGLRGGSLRAELLFSRYTVQEINKRKIHHQDTHNYRKICVGSQFFYLQ
jgi:hypothetical protein